MILSIDNKLATSEQADVIYNLTCLRCGQKFRFKDKRIVFVQLSNGQILAWHGVKNQKKGGYPCITLVRQEVISKKQAHKCQWCKKEYRSVIRIRFCSQTCEKKYFHKHIYVLK